MTIKYHQCKFTLKKCCKSLYITYILIGIWIYVCVSMTTTFFLTHFLYLLTIVYICHFSSVFCQKNTIQYWYLYLEYILYFLFYLKTSYYFLRLCYIKIITPIESTIKLTKVLFFPKRIIFKNFSIFCSHCSSHFLYHHGKDKIMDIKNIFVTNVSINSF